MVAAASGRSSPIGKLPTGWQLKPLGSFCPKIGSGATPLGGKSVYLSERTSYALIRSQHVFDRHFDSDGLAFITDSQAEDLRNAEVQSGDVLLNITGDGVTFARACLVPASVLPACVNQHVAIIRVDPATCVPGFLLSFLTHPATKRYMESFNTGASRRAITKGHIESFNIPVPPLAVQVRISGILSAYDDLIVNNTRRIQILERMAQALYREWFVHFRLPGHAQVKLAASPLGRLPQGWQAKNLGDVVELAYGRSLKSEQRVNGPYPVYGSSGVVGVHNEALVKGPGIIVGRKGNVGSVFWTDDDFYPIDTVFFVRTEAPLHYVFYNLKHQTFLNNDAAVPGLNRNAAYMKPFILPDSGTLAAFQSFVEPVFKQLRILNLKNANLRRTRDLLLPKLISGALDVSKLDMETGAAAS